ncbi:MAG TPA: anthranilate synthase component I family protein [Caulobacteraceae bacterium]|jgi:para-aminobenzoate synthetase component 1|nr:anthranilate synthase component I family protein [Caulobacteraceae bacterium]
MSVVLKALDWREPLAVAAAFADEPWAVLLLSSGAGAGRWSYFARRPAATAQVGREDGDGDFARLRAMLGPRRPTIAGAPPFQGGVIGLAAYEFADRLEPPRLPRDADWPDLVLARYDALLAFDHETGAILALGRGEDARAANHAADEAAAWLDASKGYIADPDPPAAACEASSPGACYEAAVAGVKMRIAGGEIFQANIARRWTGTLTPGAGPFAAFARLARASPAPYCAWWRLPGLALVSHSPERFIAVADGAVETSPIKGTRPRGANPAEDNALARELLASEKDRAENLMIVDLMRNDLSRVCVPGSVKTPRLFDLTSYPAVHHLVSTVTGRLEEGLDAADLLAAAFPPGSITGAPKIQAMKVIAALEPPRGPWCGTLFWAGLDGDFDSSVLIRTAAFVEEAGGWSFRFDAGAGIVADSDPASERAETEVKALALRRALTGP